jgi:alpha-tubulin suppressor-like RCC1 family protein
MEGRMKKILCLLIISVFLMEYLSSPAEAKTNASNNSLAACWEHSGVIMSDGTLLEWGNNEYGEIGDYSCGDYNYDTYDCLVLKPNAALDDVKAVSAEVVLERIDSLLWRKR